MRHRWIWLFGTAAVLVGAAYAVAFLIDEPLRRHMEAEINGRLTGYTVRIRALGFHPLGFSLDLEDATIYQDAHPDPPVARIPRLTARVDRRALLHARLVADFVIERPTVHVNLKQLGQEVRDPVPLKERGWQEALQAIYPLKINTFRVRDGEVTYVDQGPFKPLRLHRLTILAENIRNVRSKEGVFPSDIRAEAVVFDAGRLLVTGRADFLAEPHVALRADIELQRVELDYFKPVTNRYNVQVTGGMLSAAGTVEYAPRVKVVELRDVQVDGARVDYVHATQTAVAESQTAQAVARSAKEVSNHPELSIRIAQLKIAKSTFGFVNRAATPPYRLFLADTDLTLRNLSNQGVEGTATAKIEGRFMGSGATVVTTAFRPEADGAKLDVAVQIDDTHMPAMNDLLRAYGSFDVVDGRFSLYSTLSIRDGMLTGYVKPLFRDMNVYDSEQDRDKGFWRRVYEAMIGGLARVLKNTPRQEVATKVSISGPVSHPQTSTWEAVRRLLQNAFVRAILPGFEETTESPSADREASRVPPVDSPDPVVRDQPAGSHREPR